MTPQQYTKLPPLMKESVDNDRKIELLVSPSVVAISTAHGLRKLQKRRTELVTAAQHTYGTRINGDNKTHA